MERLIDDCAACTENQLVIQAAESLAIATVTFIACTCFRRLNDHALIFAGTAGITSCALKAMHISPDNLPSAKGLIEEAKSDPLIQWIRAYSHCFLLGAAAFGVCALRKQTADLSLLMGATATIGAFAVTMMLGGSDHLQETPPGFDEQLFGRPHFGFGELEEIKTWMRELQAHYFEDEEVIANFFKDTWGCLAVSALVYLGTRAIPELRPNTVVFTGTALIATYAIRGMLLDVPEASGKVWWAKIRETKERTIEQEPVKGFIDQYAWTGLAAAIAYLGFSGIPSLRSFAGVAGVTTLTLAIMGQNIGHEIYADVIPEPLPARDGRNLNEATVRQMRSLLWGPLRTPYSTARQKENLHAYFDENLKGFLAPLMATAPEHRLVKRAVMLAGGDTLQRFQGGDLTLQEIAETSRHLTHSQRAVVNHAITLAKLVQRLVNDAPVITYDDANELAEGLDGFIRARICLKRSERETGPPTQGQAENELRAWFDGNGFTLCQTAMNGSCFYDSVNRALRSQDVTRVNYGSELVDGQRVVFRDGPVREMSYALMRRMAGDKIERWINGLDLEQFYEEHTDNRSRSGQVTAASLREALGGRLSGMVLYDGEHAAISTELRRNILARRDDLDELVCYSQSHEALGEYIRSVRQDIRMYASGLEQAALCWALRDIGYDVQFWSFTVGPGFVRERDNPDFRMTEPQFIRGERAQYPLALVNLNQGHYQYLIPPQGFRFRPMVDLDRTNGQGGAVVQEWLAAEAALAAAEETASTTTTSTATD